MINIDKINKAISDGYINVQTHPSGKLMIYNYSQKAQFEWYWPQEVMQCRGLILDNSGNIVARPFEKFFSYDQLNGKIPDEPFEVFEKVDGSLGILYWLDGEPFISTRGSFESEQAQVANQIFQTMKNQYRFDKSVTYLFEIIYPENRIVVNYGGKKDLVLLAVIETETGIEIPIPLDYSMSVVKRYDGINDFGELLKIQEENKEGFVVRFKSGQRVKLKFEEYKRLHKLLTGISPKLIWECLSNGTGVEKLIERVPDEFHAWVKEIELRLKVEYAIIENKAHEDFQDTGNRKETAEYFKTKENTDLLFAILDHKNYAPMIWKKIKPKGERCFKCDIDL
jgi:RNA ligase